MIEPQPRGLSAGTMLLKVNEIIEKFNAQEAKVAALEAAARPAENDDLLNALKQADNAIQKAIAHFQKEVK